MGTLAGLLQCYHLINIFVAAGVPAPTSRPSSFSFTALTRRPPPTLRRSP